MGDERLTKKERRERARLERKRAAEEEARRQRRNRILTVVASVVAVAGVVALFLTTRQPAGTNDVAIDRAQAAQAASAAGCETVDIPQLEASHLDDPAPPASALYPVRPTHSGPHFPITNPVGTFRSEQDERLTTHNLEHGAIVVWYDPARVDGTTADEIRSWADDRNRAGFEAAGGTGVLVSPIDAGLSTGKAVALRAWGVASDCASWDRTAADAFVIDNYGGHGQAPERFAAFPEDVLYYTGEAPEPATEESGGGDHSPEEAPATGS